MKKVLQITGSLRIGGLEKVAYNYYKYINKNEYNFTYLVFSSEEEGYGPLLTEMGANIIRIPAPGQDYFGYIRRIRRILNDFGPFDVVHSHLFFNSGLAMKAAYLEGVPIRISHSHTYNRTSKGLLRIAYMKIMKYMIKKYSTDYLASSSLAGEYLFGESLFKKEGIVIKNAIDNSLYNFDYRNRLKIRNELDVEEKIVLGHTGTLNIVKNQTFLIDVAYELKMRKMDFTLLLIGNGPQKETLEEKVIHLGLEREVIFIGQKDNIEFYLSAMDIFLFPSLYEGLGISVVEAQANNLPCIVSPYVPNEAIINEYTQRRELDVAEWVNCIADISTKKISRVKENNLRKNNYDIPGMMKILYDVYNNNSIK